MKLKDLISFKAITLMHGGKIPFTNINPEHLNYIVDVEVNLFIDQMLGTKDSSIGIDFLDQIDNYSIELSKHPSIIFDNKDDFKLFYTTVFAKYSMNVITQFFRMIIQSKIMDIFELTALHPEKNGIHQIIPPPINIETRFLSQINTATLFHGIPSEITKLYEDPINFLFYAFPSISNYELDGSFIRELYYLIVGATHSVIQLFYFHLISRYDSRIAERNFALFLFTIMEYSNSILANYLDEDHNLIDSSLRFEFFGIAFGFLYFIEERFDNKFLNLKFIMDCDSKIKIPDKKNDELVLQYRGEMIAMFILLMGELCARLETDYSNDSKRERKDNVINFSTARKSAIITAEFKSIYEDMAESIVEQLKTYVTKK